MNRRPRILLADDHTMLLDAFRRLLEPGCEIVGTAGDGRALVDLAVDTRPDVVVSRHLDAAAQRHGRLRAAPPKNAAHEICLPHGE
jgi:DNA-binding NarL/FixJ family response regulator